MEDNDLPTKCRLPEDPAGLYSFINKYVTVEVIMNKTYTGYIDAIDPITKSTILSASKGDNFHKMLIPGHGILNITETKPLTDKKPIRKSITTVTDEEISRRKSRIIEWMQKNLIPAQEKNGAIEIGSVSILPPFTSMDVCTSNVVVAGQIKKLMDSMPHEFDVNIE